MDQRCLIGASAYYRIPPEILVALRMQEGGTVGRYSVNTNGTVDMGPMQINSIHLKTLQHYGINGQYLVNNECGNIFAGAWVLSQYVTEARGDIWQAVGYYHSHSQDKMAPYQRQVAARLRRVQKDFNPYVQWLRANALIARNAMDGHPSTSVQDDEIAQAQTGSMSVSGTDQLSEP